MKPLWVILSAFMLGLSPQASHASFLPPVTQDFECPDFEEPENFDYDPDTDTAPGAGWIPQQDMARARNKLSYQWMIWRQRHDPRLCPQGGDGPFATPENSSEDYEPEQFPPPASPF